MRHMYVCTAAAFGLALAVTPPSPASITMSLDILDGEEPGAPAPPGLVVVDVSVDVSKNDFFVGAAITGTVANGATLVYGGSPRFRPPGLNNRHVSFGSFSYGRNDAPRFAPAGTEEEPTIVVSPAGYDPPGSNSATPTMLNLIYIISPISESTPRGRDGFVMRLVFDIGNVALPGGEEPANYRIFLRNQEPPGYQPVFMSHSPSYGPGTSVSSLEVQTPIGVSWGLYVPEPSTFWMLILVFRFIGRMLL